MKLPKWSHFCSAARRRARRTYYRITGKRVPSQEVEAYCDYIEATEHGEPADKITGLRDTWLNMVSTRILTEAEDKAEESLKEQ